MNTLAQQGRRVLILVGLLFALCTEQSQAQALEVSLSIMNRPGSSLAEWLANPDAVFLSVNNPRKEAIQFKIQTLMKKDTLLVARTKINEMPVLTLAPGTTLLHADNLVPPEAVEFMPQIQRTAQRGALLPPGNYSLCVQLVEPTAPEIELSDNTCKGFYVPGFDVPQLLEPINFATLDINKRIVFRWKGIIPQPSVPKIVRYRVQVYEVSKGQDALHALQTTQPIMERYSDNVQPLLLYWQPEKALFDSTREYIWTVQAVDTEGKPYGEPEGKAEPFIFRVTK